MIDSNGFNTLPPDVPEEVGEPCEENGSNDPGASIPLSSLSAETIDAFEVLEGVGAVEAPESAA